MMSTSLNQDEQFKDGNIIIGQIEVDENDVMEKKEIRIINSYENFQKDRNIERNGYSFRYDNEREIRRVIKIIIDELSSNYVYESNLISLLNKNSKLLYYETNNEVMTLDFNNSIFWFYRTIFFRKFIFGKFNI